MKLSRFIPALTLLASISAPAVNAEDVPFDSIFADATLRLDYMFTGDKNGTEISVDRLYLTPGWYGRRHNMTSVPLQGNGQVVVRDAATDSVIYVTSFSSLFQEWINTDEAGKVTRSFENSFLVPQPLDSAYVTVTLFDNRRQPEVSFTHPVDPTRDILIARPDVDHPLPHRYIHKSGDPREKIDVAIIAEGYTVEEMDSFYHHANRAVESILSHEPFKSMADRFNFVAVASPSRDSGVSIPRLGQWKDTAVSSHFSTFYSDRYLTTSNVNAVHDLLAGIPYEHLIILANTDEYGGGGIYNSYTLTTARHPLFWPVVTHEFGHSFGGLGDEYFYTNDDEMSAMYPVDVEPWEPNITTLVDFDSKWKHLLPEGTPIPTPVEEAGNYPVGVYEGAGYSFVGRYRPANLCRMRVNKVDSFCPGCIDALTKLIDFYTAPAKN